MTWPSKNHQQLLNHNLKSSKTIGSHYDFMQWERNRNRIEYNREQKALPHPRDSVNY